MVVVVFYLDVEIRFIIVQIFTELSLCGRNCLDAWNSSELNYKSLWDLLFQWKETDYPIICCSGGRRRNKEIPRRDDSKCWERK